MPRALQRLGQQDCLHSSLLKTATSPCHSQGRCASRRVSAQQSEREILSALRGKVVSPQVVVSLAPWPTNGLTVLGHLATPGRVQLIYGVSNILDILAGAGGVQGLPENAIIHLISDGQTCATPLKAIYSDPRENIILKRGIRSIWRPSRDVTAASRLSELLRFQKCPQVT